MLLIHLPCGFQDCYDFYFHLKVKLNSFHFPYKVFEQDCHLLGIVSLRARQFCDFFFKEFDHSYEYLKCHFLNSAKGYMKPSNAKITCILMCLVYTGPAESKNTHEHGE